MDSRYDHHQHEEKTRQLWEESKAFSPDSPANSNNNSSRSSKTFTIMMPPPNANDSLHIGHAMFVALEDILTRYHRMLGDDTLWLPGTDHAGIETQFLFEKKLKKNGQSRFQFDRETLYQMIWDYVQENSNVAVDQMKKLGASADWDRFLFMLDPDVVKIVLDNFKKLHDQDLVYRDLRLVNFCVHCGTAFSELEIEHQDQQTPLYYVKYRFADNPEKHLTIATVRPEPIWADTHLAVHPDDEKNNHLIGQKVLNPLTDEVMTIIGDEFVDPEFGTGIVKLTPAHDPHDFEVAQKHNLPIHQAIDTFGKMTKEAGKYADLKVKAAREQVVADLEAKGLIEKVDEKYQNRIATCYRCGRPIEPLPLPQFFIKVKPLVEPILEALDKNEIKVHGAGHDKILKHWLENLKDWNISRQIVWGIRMPVWYKVADNPNLEVTFLTKTGEKKYGKLSEFLEENHTLEEVATGLQELRAPVEATFEISQEPLGEGYLQETDTFDTWFSSAQWPYSTLQALQEKNGNPAGINNQQETAGKTAGDFDRFYPTQVMETGYDILPFWVMRMLMMGKFSTGQLPFTDIYLHGLVRDEKGKKMSKSKGNVINPLEIIDEYGADALRMALVIRSSAGLDKSVGKPDFKAMRNFTNKIWNAARFITNYLEVSIAADNTLDEKKFREKLDNVVKDVNQQLTDFKLGLAAETLHNEFWHWFCDECIEQNKAGKLQQKALIDGLKVFLKLLHPFMPFVTEAIWQELKKSNLIRPSEKMLITSAWPK